MNVANITDDPALPAPNREATIVLEVDTDGVRVRDAVHLFLSGVVEQQREQQRARTHHTSPPPRSSTLSAAHVSSSSSHSVTTEENATTIPAFMADTDAAAVFGSTEFDYITEQLERISTSSSWCTCVVRWSHLVRFDEHVALAVESDFQRFAGFLNEALHRTLTQYYADDYANRGRCHPALVFSFVPRCLTIRALRASMVGQLCAIQGVVTRTSQVRPELLVAVFRCGDCGTESEPVEQPFHYLEPASCRRAECENKARFQLIPHHPQTRFGDWQKLRMQEDANHIPAGCMPRTMEVIVRGDGVDVAKPGDRIRAVGCAIVVPEVAKLFNQANRREVQRQMSGAQRGQQEAQASMEGATGLRALGVRDLNYRMSFLASTITDASGDDRKMREAVKEVSEEEDGGQLLPPAQEDDAAEAEAGGVIHAAATLPRPMLSHSGGEHAAVVLTAAEAEKVAQMRRSEGLLRRLTSCVAPNIFKHEVVKLGLLLQMFGGVSKTTTEKIILRGDINVCIIGDPSTAKSQFLKWVSSHVSRGVYTSGKASTASGLTATVTRDSDTGERTIEAGALMLSDRGVCCIDEFDKMDIKDQVAIHEAMEQQTISIAKAGIRATLNAKTSLLAALNPMGGKYDRRKPLQKNIVMSAPIMSRFDLMFVIVDDAGDEADFAMANQLLRLHRLGSAAVRQAFSVADFQLYMRYARSLTPRLTAAASELIVAAYRDMRLQDSLSNRSKVYRVTTRMLESMIRLSEATAKMFLSEEVMPSHVEVALEVMRQSLSTLDMTEVELSDGVDGGDGRARLASYCDPSRSSHNTATGADASRDSGARGGQADGEGVGARGGRRPRGEDSSGAAAAGAADGRAVKRERVGGEEDAAASAAPAASGPTADSSSLAETARVGGTAATATSAGAASRKVVITADHYFSIVNRLVAHLQLCGEENAPTRQELVTWYLEQVQSLNRAQLETELRYVNLVLTKMVRQGKLLEVESVVGDGMRIYLDPNFNPDVTQQ